jgi:hypothetical protein
MTYKQFFKLIQGNKGKELKILNFSKESQETMVQEDFVEKEVAKENLETEDKEETQENVEKMESKDHQADADLEEKLDTKDQEEKLQENVKPKFSNFHSEDI